MSTRTLKLAKDLALPLSAVTQKLAWLGVTGSGKTYGASKLAELFWHAGAQFVVVDPVGVWYGLRLAKDGKKPSDVTIPIFGGLHGDVPLEATGGALLANLIVDETLSAIIDVSQFESDAEKARFALDFAERFFFRKKAAPSAVHVFLEECQEFVPQNPQRGEERMLHAFTRMQKLGRNFGIGSSYISQRPQEVNKKALNMAQTLFVFRTTGTHERKAIESWIADKSLDEDIAGDLPKIATGDCHVWSPEFLKISETVHILEKHTFNASATPDVGGSTKARELAPIDLEKVRAEMAATIEKAKAEDPRELRKQIAELKAALSKGAHVMREKGQPPKVQQVPVLTDADRELLDKLQRRFDVDGSHGPRTIVAMGAIEKAFDDFRAGWTTDYQAWVKDVERRLESKGVQKIFAKLAVAHTAAAAANPVPTAAHRALPARPPATLRPSKPIAVPEGPVSDDRRLTAAAGDLKKHVRAILTALAQHPDGRTREQVLILAGYSPSGDISTAFAGLLEHGLVASNGAGPLRITDAGLELLGDFEPLPAGAELRAELLNGSRLGSAERKLLGALFDAYPEARTRAQLHEAAGLKPSGDTSTAIGKFRKLGWVETRDGGLAAAATFFPEDE